MLVRLWLCTRLLLLLDEGWICWLLLTVCFSVRIFQDVDVCDVWSANSIGIIQTTNTNINQEFCSWSWVVWINCRWICWVDEQQVEHSSQITIISRVIGGPDESKITHLHGLNDSPRTRDEVEQLTKNSRHLLLTTNWSTFMGIDKEFSGLFNFGVFLICAFFFDERFIEWLENRVFSLINWMDSVISSCKLLSVLFTIISITVYFHYLFLSKIIKSPHSLISFNLFHSTPKLSIKFLSQHKNKRTIPSLIHFPTNHEIDINLSLFSIHCWV